MEDYPEDILLSLPAQVQPFPDSQEDGRFRDIRERFISKFNRVRLLIKENFADSV